MNSLSVIRCGVLALGFLLLLPACSTGPERAANVLIALQREVELTLTAGSKPLEKLCSYKGITDASKIVRQGLYVSSCSTDSTEASIVIQGTFANTQKEFRPLKETKLACSAGEYHEGLQASTLQATLQFTDGKIRTTWTVVGDTWMLPSYSTQVRFEGSFLFVGDPGQAGTYSCASAIKMGRDDSQTSEVKCDKLSKAFSGKESCTFQSLE